MGGRAYYLRPGTCTKAIGKIEHDQGSKLARWLAGQLSVGLRHWQTDFWARMSLLILFI
jgi:hypothetical protein